MRRLIPSFDRRGWSRLLLLLTIGVAAAWGAGLEPRTAPPLPQAGPVPPGEFTALIARLSEPEGYFDSDNFISNETSYLHVVDRLRERVAPGGVYLGVGPDQNFTYLVHSRPALAFIVDIRRQNLLEHLIFKVLIEQAESRYDFLCAFLARECPELEDGAFEAMLAAVHAAPGREDRARAALARIERTLREDYALPLAGNDLERIEYVYMSFFRQGLDLRFSSFGQSAFGYPTWMELLSATDLAGDRRGFLSDEESFRWLQQFQRENRLIPIVGDFAGAHALTETAAYLAERGLPVSVFYTSNVEYYLFGQAEWTRWVANVHRFSYTADAVFLRAYFPTRGPIHPQNVPGHRPTTLIQPVAGFIQDAAAGRLRTYWDVVSRNLY